MAKIYFTGLNASKFMFKYNLEMTGTLLAIDNFLHVSCEGMTNIEIGWDYFLIWKNNKLYVTKKMLTNNFDKLQSLIKLPEPANLNFKQAIAGSENIVVLMSDHNIWIYNFDNNIWKKVPNFISIANIEEQEYIVKIDQGRCIVALTNLGQVYNIPISFNNVNSIKFVDIACGYDHTILLTENGKIYSIGIGTRGQLGHGDLEDCAEPKLIETLESLTVIHIAAGGWHSAAITYQGDLYTWGWNNEGQLGQPNFENIIAVPTMVIFTNEILEVIEYNINKVQCGSTFTICRTDGGVLLGCGSNKYGQLGFSRKNISTLKRFNILKLNNFSKYISDFKCREWSCCIYVN